MLARPGRLPRAARVVEERRRDIVGAIDRSCGYSCIRLRSPLLESQTSQAHCPLNFWKAYLYPNECIVMNADAGLVDRGT